MENNEIKVWDEFGFLVQRTIQNNKGSVLKSLPIEQSNEELAVAWRAKRDSCLKKYVDVYSGIRWESLSEEKKEKLSNYRQALLDLPQQVRFPRDVDFPELPF